MMQQTFVSKRQRRLVWILGLIAVGMFGFCFALVPLYNVICKTTGLNGKPSNMVSGLSTQTVDTSRWVKIEFLTSTNANLPWEFRSHVNVIKIHPGENKLVMFYAKNLSGKTMIIQAIPSVAPGVAAKYLKKTECFCFTQQTFKNGEAKEMPVLFHIDNDLPSDIHEISLAYTLFDAGKFAKQPTAERGKIAQ